MTGDNCDQCLEHSGRIAETNAIKESVNTLNGQLIAIVSGQHEIRQSVAAQGRSIEYMEEKMDKMDHLTEAVLRMSMAIEASTAKTEQGMEKIFSVLTAHDTRMNSHETAIQEIQATPAKEALKLQDIIKGMFVTAFVGGFIALLWDKVVSIWRSAP